MQTVTVSPKYQVVIPKEIRKAMRIRPGQKLKVIVDTSVWSLAFRREKTDSPALVQELRHIIHDHRAQMMGPIRQEILSGIRSKSQFKKLRKHLESFPDLPIFTEDYVTAAQFFNHCRSKGIQGSKLIF